MNSKVIQQYQNELFDTEVDLSDTNQQRGWQTRPKHHTYKDHVYLDHLFLVSIVSTMYWEILRGEEPMWRLGWLAGNQM